MAEPFEYAIKKDVRNNAIVREVDEARVRDLWKSVGMVGLFVAALLFSAWQHFELLQHGYRIEEMQREKGAEEELTRRLRLEDLYLTHGVYRYAPASPRDRDTAISPADRDARHRPAAPRCAGTGRSHRD